LKSKKKKLILISLAICILIAVFLSPLASNFPDGLEFIAEKLGFIGKGEQTVLNSPVPDYNFGFIKNEYVSKAIAGAFGVIVVFTLGWGLDKILRRRK
jgi:hypothetical protein